MPGRYEVDVEIKADVAKLLADVAALQDRLNAVEKKEYKITFGVEDEVVERTIRNLDKLLHNLGKGTGDFKQFKVLSENLEEIIVDVKAFSKAFASVDSSGANALLSSIKNIDKSLSDLRNHIVGVKKEFDGLGDGVKNNNSSSSVNEQIKKFKELKNTISEYSEVRKRIASGKAFDDDIQKTEELKTTINEIMGKADGSVTILSQSQLSDAQDRLDKIDKTIDDINRKNVLKKDNSLDSYTKKSAQYSSTLNKFQDGGWASDAYTEQVNKFTNALDQYEAKLKELRNQPSLINKDSLADLDRLESKMKQASNAISSMSAAQKGFSMVAGQKEMAKIRQILSENSAMSRKAKLDIKAYYEEIKSGNPSASLDKIHAEILKIVDAEAEAGRSGKSMWSAIKEKAWYGVASFVGTYFGLQDFVRYIKEGAQETIAFNDALTNMSYTMDISSSQLNTLGKNVIQSAKDMHTSLSNMEQIYQIYANMNTTTEELNQLAQPTAILSNLGNFDASTAADDIQAVMNQFDLASKDADHIVDVFDHISANIKMNYSTGIEGIANAVQNVGNVANEAGLSFEQLSAIIAKTMEQTRMDGSSLGNSLKTILTRISKASVMDDTVDNEALSNASKSLHEIGVEVYKTNGEFREFDTIMSELSSKWDTLTDAQQANISYQVAATRQTSVLRAILNNWTDSMDLASEAVDANGNALANQEKYAESYSGKIQDIKTEISSLWINMLDGKGMSNTLSFVDSLLSKLSELQDKGKLLSSVSTIVSGILGLTGKGLTISYIKKWNQALSPLLPSYV